MRSEQMNSGGMGHILTRRMASVVDGLREKYAALYNTRDFMSKISYLEKCDSDEISSVQMELVHMYKKCGIDGVKMDREPAYYEDLLKRSNIPGPRQMARRVYETFFQELSDNPYPLPEEYIERMVKGKIAPEWENDTLRLKILKKFIRDAGALEAAGYKMLYIRQYVKRKTGKKNVTIQDILENLDDAVFYQLKGADHQQTRKSGKYGLLKIADDLAHGKFGNANVVREEIYLFAIVFELTYSTGDPEETATQEEMERDIENVMFGDYYTNNIMRYISGGHKYIKSGGEEQSPTGKGINYKNYMEVIFLYYLRRRDLNAEEKLKAVYAMADEVYTGAVSGNVPDRLSGKRPAGNVTKYYGDVFKENVSDSEETFKNFLISNYDCTKPPKTTPVFSVEMEQQTALNEYHLLLEDAEDYGVADEDYDKRRIAFLREEMDLDKIKKIQEDREKNTADFESIDDKTKFDILLYEVNRDLGKKKSKKELERKIISRTDILRLFYQIYINMNDETEDDDSLQSFPEVYDDFSDLANQHLVNALLRPINGRDLYDLILIYSAYCMINEDKFD